MLDPIMNPTEDQFSNWMAQYYPPQQPSRRLSDLALSPQDQAALMADLQQTQDPENAAIMQQMAQQEAMQQPMQQAPRAIDYNTLSRLANEGMQQGNTIVNNATGRVIDMNYATKPLRELTPADQQASIAATGGPRTKYDPSVDGPRVLSRKQLPDGRIEVIKQYVTGIAREIETPEYLNPAELKRIDYQTKVAAMEKAQREAKGGDVKPVFHEGQWVYPPSQANPSGQAVPVGGFKKAPTEDERKTSYNVGRILQSAKMVQDVAAKDKGSLAPGVVEAAAGVVPLWDTAQEGLKNLSRSSNRQIVNQSQADIIDSLLFLATGAAYNKEQLAQQRASYQPNFTDSPEAVNAKNERMQGLIEAAKVRAGNAWTPEMDAALNVLSIPKMETGKRTSSGKIGGAPVTIRSDDDYARLPSGTVFTGPDGVRRRKP